MNSVMKDETLKQYLPDNVKQKVVPKSFIFTLVHSLKPELYIEMLKPEKINKKTTKG